MYCTRSWIAGFFFFFAVVMAIPANATEITFYSKVQVYGPEILLGDIAKITAPEAQQNLIARIAVSASPNAGKTKSLSGSTIISALRHNAMLKGASWKGQENILVFRATMTLAKEKLHQIITKYLHDNLDKLPNAEIKFTSFRAPAELNLPKGELSWKVIPSNPDIISSSSFSILFKVNGKQAENCTVRGKLEAMAPVVTVSVKVNRGDIITPDQVVLIQKDVTRLEQPYFDLEEVIGKQAKRTLTAGKVLEQRYLQSAPVIRKGEMVKILATKGNLRLETNGLARANGQTGEVIRVQNINSNKLIHCRVDGPGRVSVEF